MDTLDRLLQISSRLEHLENSAEWIARESVHDDNGISQTSTLICVLADEIREMIFALTHDLEQLSTPAHDEDEETIH
jgi:hypothetical protein